VRLQPAPLQQTNNATAGGGGVWGIAVAAGGAQQAQVGTAPLLLGVGAVHLAHQLANQVGYPYRIAH
jgi:hypothetical protein